MTHKKEFAGGFETTTADTNYSTKIISLCTRCKAAFIRLAQLLASFFRGLA